MAGGMKRLAKETAVYGLAVSIGRFWTGCWSHVYPCAYWYGDYGVVTNIYGWIALLMVILTYGLENRFLLRFMNKKRPIHHTSIRPTLSLYFYLPPCFQYFYFVPATISSATGYAKYPEFIGIMGIVVAVDAFCSLPFAYLRYQGKAYRFAGLKLFNIFLSIALNVFFLVVCPWLYTNHPDTVNWFFLPIMEWDIFFISNAITTFVTLCMLYRNC